MATDPKLLIPRFFTRSECITDEVLNVRNVQRDLFGMKRDGKVIHFIIAWLTLVDGRIIPAVEHPDHLPLLDKVLKALESSNG